MMKVLVAGASGAIGRQLVPLLAAAGHQVVGLSRSSGSGALPAVDVLDRTAVLAAVHQIAPDAIVHMATAIPARLNPRRMTAEFTLTNRLRTEGTRHLLDAARESGVRRVITQGLAFAYEPGDGLADEQVPLWRLPPKPFASSVAALRQLEAMTLRAGGTVLRLGHLYGPGTMFAAEGSVVDDIRARRLPVAGGGHSVFSFIHVADVADAIAAALDHGTPGVLNVVDDDPAPIRNWLPELADVLRAPRPRRLPLPVVRLVAGGWGAAYLGALRGADNARARRALNWQPRHPSWRAGLVDELRSSAPSCGRSGGLALGG
jgi:nucleoside-diphosphate-sugar epimerase